MADFYVNILGCGSALPTIRHSASSQIVELRNKSFMIDCGEGSQVQMRHMRIGFSKLSHIFISHLHGDHCFGLPGLLSTLGMVGRIGELVIHGPVGLDTYLRPILNQFCKGMPYEVRFNIVDTKQYALIYEDRSLEVYSIPLLHRIPTMGFLFCEKQKEPHIIREMTDFYKVPISFMKHLKAGEDFVTEDGVIIPNNRLTRPSDPPLKYAYCSDTTFKPDIVPLIEGVDVLYHEATFASDQAQRARETFHSTASQAATIAKEAGVKRLILGHYSARYEDLTPIIEEARLIFPQAELGEEGNKIIVE